MEIGDQQEQLLTQPNTDKGDFHDAWDGLIDVTFDVLRGNARHASRICSESVQDDAEIDVFQEIAQFWTRAGGDAGRAVNASQEFFETLRSPKADAANRPTQASGPVSPAGPCTVDLAVGPFDDGGAITPMPLRHRGDPAASITAAQIKVTPNTVAKGPDTILRFVVDLRGAARGLYVGELKVGSQEIPYNIYIDPS